MWVNIRLGIFLVAVCSVSAAAQSVGLDLEMDQDPTLSGWSVHDGGGGSHFVSPTGVLSVSSPYFYEFWAPASFQKILSNSAGWEIDTRFRFTGGSNDITIWVHDNTEVNVIRFGTTSFKVYAGPIGYEPVFPYDIGTDFHSYHIAAAGEWIKMWIDGNLALDLVHPEAGGGTKVIYFGDGSYSFPTYSEWDYFRIGSPAPEPACALGALLAVAMLRRTRQRGFIPLNIPAFDTRAAGSAASFG